MNPRNSYSIRIRSTDQGSLYTEKTFTINVTNVNEQPTDISLSNNSVAENQPTGTAVGTLSTTDPDTGNTFTYSLVSGIGSTDNGSFTIAGGALKTAAIFDYETKNSYSIRISSTDQGGLSFEKVFAITVSEPTTHIWDGGGGDNKWSTAANWVGDVKPLPGDNLLFPTGAKQLESVNDYSTTTVFGSITVSGSGYSFSNGIST